MTQSRWNCELLLSMRELCHRAIVLATALRFMNPESYLRMYAAGSSCNQFLLLDSIMDHG